MFSFFLLSSQHFAHEGFLLRVRRAPFGREQPPASGGNAVIGQAFSQPYGVGRVVQRQGYGNGYARTRRLEVLLQGVR